MSHYAITYHIIFAPWRRQSVIDAHHERELYKFMFDFAQERGVKVWRIGGMPDHVHLLCDIPPKIAVADFVKLIKAESSKFLRVNSHFPHWVKWCDGYASVSVDVATRPARVRYIMNQKEHHARRSFAEEYADFLREYGFAPDTPILGDEPRE